jgi:hypothetical protein
MKTAATAALWKGKRERQRKETFFSYGRRP